MMDFGIYGQVETWTNTRSCQTGKPGDGLNVRWREAYFKGGKKPYSHLGIKEYYDSYESGRLDKRIQFARIYGTKPAFGNLGVQDYVFLEHKKLGDEKHEFKVRVWKNVGQGGTKVVADGNK